jgi:homogentisate 1,2-dioxygenase
VTYYRRVGDVSRKRHTVHRDADGTRLLEELMGTQGFAGASSLLYHRHSPSALVDTAPHPGRCTDLAPNEPVAPVHLRTSKLPSDRADDLVTSRHVLAGNDDVVLSFVRAATSSPLYRNVTGDELVYVHDGALRFESVFGALDVGAGDYVVVPAGTTHRWLPARERGDDAAPAAALVLEASTHVRPPSRYLTARGQFLEHAPYCERDLRAPNEPVLAEGEGVEVVVRTRAGWSCHRYEHHPFDVIGWDGSLYPYAFSIHDFEPVVGRLHQPPHVHQTFEGDGFVVCSFVPRPFDFHPDAVKIPYHHSNVDSDEVLFYADGSFMSRAGSGIERGSVTVHPAGFVHGPQPGSYERSVNADRTEELAVMIDTFRPLQLGVRAREQAGDDDYMHSWTEH